jgi:hypothetical protein
MFTVGHIASAFIITYVISRFVSLKGISIPLVIFLSILPDIDIVLQTAGIVSHKSLTHSVIISLIVALLFIAKYPKPSTVIYSIAYLQHIAIGDTIIESLNILYPFGYFIIGLGIKYGSLTHIIIETFLLAIMATIVTTEYLHKKNIMRRDSIFLTQYHSHHPPQLDAILYLIVIVSMFTSFAYTLYDFKIYTRFFAAIWTELGFIFLNIAAILLIIFMWLKSSLVLKVPSATRR